MGSDLTCPLVLPVASPLSVPTSSPQPLFSNSYIQFFLSIQDSPLKTLMSRYEEAMGLSGHKLSFFFDGTKLSGKELPADLGMESGDLIEVWS